MVSNMGSANRPAPTLSIVSSVPTSPMAGRAAYTDLQRPPLDVDALRHALRVGEPQSWWQQLSVVQSTDSTNADLATAARTGADGSDGGMALLAEHQRAGRGRLGRAWQAPPRSALTLSVLVHPRVPTQRWPWLPLLTGVAVAEAVRRATGVDAVLKWPNDVLVGDRKLAGVLLERVDAPAGPAAVLGIGLNVSAASGELPVPSATSLMLEGAESTDRQTIAVAVLRTLQMLYAAWTQSTAEDLAGGLAASYVRRCSTLGRQVRVELPDGSVLAGLAETVDAGGRLVLAGEWGRRVLAAGDVVHLRASS